MQIMHNIFISFMISCWLKSSWIIKHDSVFLNHINIFQINSLIYTPEDRGLQSQGMRAYISGKLQIPML